MPWEASGHCALIPMRVCKRKCASNLMQTLPMCLQAEMRSNLLHSQTSPMAFKIATPSLFVYPARSKCPGRLLATAARVRQLYLCAFACGNAVLNLVCFSNVAPGVSICFNRSVLRVWALLKRCPWRLELLHLLICMPCARRMPCSSNANPPD